MNVSKDGKTLYFSDDEIPNNIEGERQVFVTKRINGKETHLKKEDKNQIEKTKKEQQSLSYDTFNFDNEIVIGVNSSKNEEENSKKHKKKNNTGKHTKIEEKTSKKSSEKSNKNSQKSSEKGNKNSQKSSGKSNKNSQINSEKNKKNLQKSSKKSNKNSQINSKNKTKLTQKNDYNKQIENYEGDKYKNKNKSHKLLIGIITTIILISIIMVVSLTTSLFNITSIEVIGNQKISSDTIISLSRFKKTRKYF